MDYNNKIEKEVKNEKIRQIKFLPLNLIEMLEIQNQNYIDYYSLSNQLEKEAIDIIWNEMDSRPKCKGKQPSDDIDRINQFLSDKKLPEDFYPCYQVSSGLSTILEKSTFYKSIETKFYDYIEKAEIVKPNKEYDLCLEKVYQKIKEVLPKFKDYKVHFIKLNKIDKDLCFCNKNNIYFSSDKLKEKLKKEWKFWIYIKILKILDVKIEDSFNVVNAFFNNSKHKRVLSAAGIII